METKTKTGATGLNLFAQIAQLRRLKARQLRERYREVIGHETATRHKQHLVRRIAWRLQAIAEGDISERARKRAVKIGENAELRVTVPAGVIEMASRSDAASRSVEGVPIVPMAESPLLELRHQLAPGSKLARVYQGRKVTVEVLEDGFEFEGERYKSLSAVARAATGTRWNGLLFFGLVERGRRNVPQAKVIPPPDPKPFRCAIYTRKSTEEGLDQEWKNSRPCGCSAWWTHSRRRSRIRRRAN